MNLVLTLIYVILLTLTLILLIQKPFNPDQPAIDAPPDATQTATNRENGCAKNGDGDGDIIDRVGHP